VTVLVRRRTLNLFIVSKGVPSNPSYTQSTPVNLGDVLLLNWIVRIPDGHAGLTGVALLLSGVPLVPFDNPTVPWVVGNDSTFTFPVNTEVDHGLTVLQLQNDAVNHTHYLQFEYTPISAAGSAPVTTVGAVPIS
jgi:hypothetical protein